MANVTSNLEDLKRVAVAAGHGNGNVFAKHNAGWVDVEFTERNTRPSYDRAFIRAFSPKVVKAMIDELIELRARLGSDAL